MYKDPVVDEVHQFRQQLLDQHHGDFAAYFASLLQTQQQHPERYASFAQPAQPLSGSPKQGSTNSGIPGR
jgi:hypothetical protein